MTDNLDILRQAGFFKAFASQSNEELLETIHTIRKEEYSQLFGRNYEPEKDLDLYQLAAQDDRKFLDIDLKAGVSAQNKAYIWLLEDFSQASGGHFKPADVQETWKADQGPIALTFSSNGKKITFEPDYMDDWIDGRIFEVMNNEMKSVCNEKFLLCSGPDDEWFGQNIVFIRLTSEEKELLVDKFDWNFPEQ